MRVVVLVAYVVGAVAGAAAAASDSCAAPSGDKNIQTVKDMYAAFGKGDVPAILSKLADE